MGEATGGGASTGRRHLTPRGLGPTEGLVGLDAIRAAAARLDDVARRTPVLPSHAASRAAGVEVVLKCEHLQRTGSFKLRGAYNRIALLDDESRRRGVVCASAGNHAQGVALSARLLGVAATVFMPVGAPLPKVEATRGYGAEVVLVGDGFDEAQDAAAAAAAESGAEVVHAYDHPDVVAGQGTLGLEVVEQVRGAAAVVVPVGGGGLVSGVAAAVRAVSPATRVIGVQAAGAASFPPALAAGRPVELERAATVADGIAVRRPAALTLAHVAALVDQVVTVSEEAIVRAVLLLAERAKQVVEPAGAAGLAALLDRTGSGLADPGALLDRDGRPGPVVALLCGGNVDPLLLTNILGYGLREEGRFLVLRSRVSDRPGALASLLAALVEHRVNVVAVQHHRLDTRLGVFEVEVELEVETRGPEHTATVLAALRAAGHDVVATAAAGARPARGEERPVPAGPSTPG